MATYYVRTDGNNSNDGTGSTTGQAWATVAHALGGTGTASGVTGGDTIYVAAGKYAGLTIAVSPSSTLSVIGDPAGAQFGYSTTVGPVYISNVGDRSNTGVTAGITATSKDNFLFRSLIISGVSATTCHSWTFDKCHINMHNSTVSPLTMTFTAGTNANCIISNCSVIAASSANTAVISLTCGNHSSTYTSNITITNTSCVPSFTNGGINIVANNATGIILSNIFCLNAVSSVSFIGSVLGQAKIQNSIVRSLTSSITGAMTEDYNIVLSRSGVATGANSVTTFNFLQYGDYLTQNGILAYSQFAPASTVFSQLVGYGTATDAPTTDYFGNAYVTPTIGPMSYASIGNTSTYVPTDRNASTITIAPGSTSQSIELYLGATGLTASTSGLSAYYNRTRTASVSIPLVARTIAQAWTSGGFAEVDATNMPGVYRLDVPDAALAAGADDVTIVVRGASGTNGAVMTVKLSSGGLTEAQTAGAVWNAVRSSYATAGTFGEYVNTNVNTGAIADAVWDEARSGHTTAGTFGEYVNAELVTPVTSAALVRMGPFEVKADGLGASDPLDIQKGAQHGIDIQCVDNNGAGIDITSATVTAKVYNSGATLVDTYSCTATYAADGRATFTIDTTVTNVPGTYTATITRTTGASDTQVFGPLRIYVRDI